MNIHTLAFPSSSGERSLLPGKPLTAFTVRNLDNGQKSTNTEEATRDCYTRWRTEWRGRVRRGRSEVDSASNRMGKGRGFAKGGDRMGDRNDSWLWVLKEAYHGKSGTRGPSAYPWDVCMILLLFHSAPFWEEWFLRRTDEEIEILGFMTVPYGTVS